MSVTSYFQLRKVFPLVPPSVASMSGVEGMNLQEMTECVARFQARLQGDRTIAACRQDAQCARPCELVEKVCKAVKARKHLAQLDKEEKQRSNGVPVKRLRAPATARRAARATAKRAAPAKRAARAPAKRAANKASRGPAAPSPRRNEIFDIIQKRVDSFGDEQMEVLCSWLEKTTGTNAAAIQAAMQATSDAGSPDAGGPELDLLKLSRDALDELLDVVLGLGGEAVFPIAPLTTPDEAPCSMPERSPELLDMMESDEAPCSMLERSQDVLDAMNSGAQ